MAVGKVNVERAVAEVDRLRGREQRVARLHAGREDEPVLLKTVAPRNLDIFHAIDGQGIVADIRSDRPLAADEIRGFTKRRRFPVCAPRQGDRVAFHPSAALAADHVARNRAADERDGVLVRTASI